VTNPSVPEVGWACATCHSSLNTYRPSGEGLHRYLHPAFAECSESRPVPRSCVDSVKEVCDFCTAEWAEVAFHMTAPENETYAKLAATGTARKALNHDYDVEYTEYASTGEEINVSDHVGGWAWAACAVCADLFDSRYGLGKLISRIKSGHRSHGPRSVPRAMLQTRLESRLRVRVPGRFTLDGRPLSGEAE
jgi:hypothetical protein